MKRDVVDELDAVSILEFFGDLKDPRSAINRKHLLGDICVICICAVLAGADGPKAIGTWALSKKDWLESVLQLPNGIPSHDTIGRVLATVAPSAFQTCFAKWSNRFQGGASDSEEADADPALKQIAIDGKSLRRSHDKRKGLGPLFLVSAWSVECGMSLGQLATEAKSNEITAIPELISNIEVKGAIVTIDAAGCQKNIAKQIVDAGGDYVLALKGNQGNMHKDVINWVGEQFENDFADVEARRYEVAEKGHGREVTNLYIQFDAPATLRGREDWKGLKSIGVATRHCLQAGKESYDTRYYLTTLPVAVKQFAQAVRGHWAIENTLHWCLDVTFREDESRLLDRHAAENIAWLRRFGIGLLKRVDSKESIAMRRRMAGWNEGFLTQVLGIKVI